MAGGGDHVVGVFVNNDGLSNGNGRKAASKSSWGGEFRMSALGLRFLATIVPVVSLVLTITDKQTKYIPSGLETPAFVAKTATYTQTKALEYFVVANAVVAGYSVLQAVRAVVVMLSDQSMAGSRGSAWLTFFFDQAMAYFLLSACSAATEMAYIAKQGESNLLWFSVCPLYEHFCNQVGMSIAVGFVSFFVLAMLAFISGTHLFLKSSISNMK